MRNTDSGDRLSQLLDDLRAAFALLSRLPLPPPRHFATPPAVWAWPLAGLGLGTRSTAAALLALAAGLGPGLAAALALACAALTTGAMHEDGLADTADGLWGGWEKARRLEIMKDSHIGTYGVMALLLTTLARWSAVAALLAAGHWPVLLAVAALSRAPMAVLLALLPNARGQGLSQSVGRPTARAAALSCAVALIGAGLCTGTVALPMGLAVAGSSVILARLAVAKIGGQTGDILGASQQLAELAALATATALLIPA